jgi:hypothetical protein
LLTPGHCAGLYQATTDGYWEGASGYIPYNAAYEFQLTNLGAQYFESYMEKIQLELNILGSLSYSKTLTENLLFWYVSIYNDMTSCTYVLSCCCHRVEFEHSSDVGGALQQFYFTGYPNVLFDTPFLSIDVQSKGRYCRVPRVLTFDPATTTNEASYDAAAYLASANCTESLNPYLLGYSDTFPEDQFSIRIDMNSFTTATAINSKTRSFEYLLKAEQQTFSYEFDGGMYEFGFKVRAARFISPFVVYCCVMIVRHQLGLNGPTGLYYERS